MLYTINAMYYAHLSAKNVTKVTKNVGCVQRLAIELRPYGGPNSTNGYNSTLLALATDKNTVVIVVQGWLYSGTLVGSDDDSHMRIGLSNGGWLVLE